MFPHIRRQTLGVLESCFRTEVFPKAVLTRAIGLRRSTSLLRVFYDFRVNMLS